MKKIKVAAVSYLNTKPLLYGIKKSSLMDEVELTVEFPSVIARQLRDGSIDLGLVPVAAIPDIPHAEIVSDYGIAADGKVASVSLFCEKPLSDIRYVYLDYQSRTSVKLAQVLLEHYWKKEVRYLDAPENYIERITGDTAGVIIGDRALAQNKNFPYVYDLSEHWKSFTGLPFLFAAWVANKRLPASFTERFNAANAEGLQHLDEIIADEAFMDYDLDFYYRHNIEYQLKEEHFKGFDAFSDYLKM